MCFVTLNNTPNISEISDETLKEMFQIDGRENGLSWDVRTFYFQMVYFYCEGNATKEDTIIKLSSSYRDYISQKFDAASRILVKNGKKYKGKLADYQSQKDEIISRILGYIPKKTLDAFDKDIQKLISLIESEQAIKAQKYIDELLEKYDLFSQAQIEKRSENLVPNQISRIIWEN